MSTNYTRPEDVPDEVLADRLETVYNTPATRESARRLRAYSLRIKELENNLNKANECVGNFP